MWVRSGSVMPGYVNAPDQTAAVLHDDGWFTTGDLGRLDEADYLTLAGRRKEVIFTEHGDIHPADVENVLVAHLEVAAAAVYPVVDVDGIERAVAAIVPRPGCAPSAESIVGRVREQRGPILAVEEVHVVDEIPTAPSGTVDRAGLGRTQIRSS